MSVATGLRLIAFFSTCPICPERVPPFAEYLRDHRVSRDSVLAVSVGSGSDPYPYLAELAPLAQICVEPEDGAILPAPPRGPAGREWMIKRVAAVPGDPRPAGILAAATDPLVPPGKLVVLGDNPAWSHDSRHIGYVPGDRLLGIVVRLTESCRVTELFPHPGTGKSPSRGNHP